METKTSVLALILVALAMLAPITYVLATSNTNGSFYGMMESTNDDEVTGDRDQLQDEDWWDEMREHMEEHWEELEEDGDDGHHGCH